MSVTTLPGPGDNSNTATASRTERLHEHNQRVYRWGEAFDHKYRGVAKVLGWAVDIDTHEASISVATIRRRHRQRLRRAISRATVFRHLHDLQSAGIVQIEAQYWDNGSRRGSLYRVNFGLVIKNGQVVSHGFATPIFTRHPRLIHPLRRGLRPPVTKGESISDGDSSPGGSSSAAEDEYEISDQWAGFEFEEGMKFLSTSSGKTWQLEWDDNADDEIYPWVLVNYENEDSRSDLCGDDLRALLTDGTLILFWNPASLRIDPEPVPQEITNTQPGATDPVDEDVPDVPAVQQLRPGLIFHSWEKAPSVVLTREIDGNWLVCDNGTGKELGMRTPDELLTHPYYDGGFYLEDADVEAILARKREWHEQKYGKVEHDAEPK